MTLAWRVVKKAFGDFIEEIFWLVAFNLVWCLAAVPLVSIPLILWGVASPWAALANSVTIVALPLATAGLTWLAAEIGQGKAVGWRTFVAGARRFWRPAYYWFATNVVFWSIVLITILFWTGRPDPQLAAGLPSLAAIIVTVFIALAVWWTGMQLYVFPFLFVQEVTSLRLAYRNSAILLLSRPALTIVLMILIAIITAVSVFVNLFPFFFFYFALLFLLGNRAVIETIKLMHPESEES